MQQSVTLESYLEEVKLSLPEINLTKPKSNLPPAEREALKAVKGHKLINLRKADKGTEFCGSFPFGWGYIVSCRPNLLHCVVSQSHLPSPSHQDRFSNQLGPCENTHRGKTQDSPCKKCQSTFFFYCYVCKVVTFLLLIDLKITCHTEMNSQILTFVNKYYRQQQA